jgi:peptide/nickel transport system substrate-binding protein/oligopeptide transport system substrate-binding protein
VPAAPAPAAPSAVTNVFGVELPADAAPVDQQYLRRNYRAEGEAIEFAVSVYNSAGGSYQSGMSLAMLDTDLKTAPGAADSWESSSDLKTWTFNINPDLAWSDGTPVTADDYVYTWQYYADPEHAYDFAWYFGSLDVVNWGDVNSGDKPLTALGVEAIDSKTLVFELDAPAPYTPGFMMYGSPLAKHQAEEFGPYYNNDPATAISFTPWILEEWIPNQHSVFVPNMNYNGSLMPYIEKMRHVFGERRFDQYLAGEIDTVSGPFSPADQEKLMNDEELLAQRGVSPGDFRTHYLFFDFQSAPFDDVRVRQAFAKAIDREAVIDFVVGDSAGVPSYGILMAGFPDAVTDDLKKYQGFDADTAQKLLADAGFANGDGFPKLELALRQETPLRQAVADAVASELKRNLNIDVTINNMDRKTYMAGLNEQSLQFAMVSYGFDYVDASNFLSVFKTDGRHNWNDAEFEALRTKAAGNANASERANQMVELQEILSERVGSVFLWGELQNQMHKPYMKGTWRNKNAAGWEGLQFPNWNAGFGVQNIYTLYIGDNVGDFNRSPF